MSTRLQNAMAKPGLIVAKNVLAKRGKANMQYCGEYMQLPNW
jgi:hypothetical protein